MDRAGVRAVPGRADRGRCDVPGRCAACARAVPGRMCEAVDGRVALASPAVLGRKAKSNQFELLHASILTVVLRIISMYAKALVYKISLVFARMGRTSA